VDKYPSGYRDTTDQAKTEQNKETRPALSTHIDNMDDYDTVILIYPNWWGGLPMPVLTFLEEYDFTGKTILPLCTHEGSGLGSTEKEIADACPQATVSEGLAVRGGKAADAKSDVEEWLKK
jgi:flavodoxin